MNIMLATVGTLGDVQPYVALGRGLQSAGFTVRIAASTCFRDLVQGAGLDFAPVSVSPDQALQQDVAAIGSNPIRLQRWIKASFDPLAHQYTGEIKEACKGADALLFAALAFSSADVAEALHIPCLAVYLQPVTPTRAFPSPSMPGIPAWLPLRGLANWLSFRLSNQSFFRLLKPTLDACRRNVLGLPPRPWKYYASLDTSRTPIIYGYSPLVLPKPPDWGGWLKVTGYWFLDPPAGWQPPVPLVDFLKAGLPPVYFGFGSMVDQEAQAVTGLVLEALLHTGQRGLLQGSWSQSSGSLPATVLQVESVPHEWLFPSMACVVHHGGAGTTAAGLRAGVPSVIVPFFADQPFWGQRIHALGVGPAPIPRKALTAGRLAQAIIIATQDAAMRQRASALGERIRGEDGVARAVEVIEDWLK
jgi:sterol 3beta-glucosyltransferase